LLRKAVDAKPTFAMSEWAKKQTYRSPEGLAHMVAVLEELGVPTLYENPPKRPHQLPLRVISGSPAWVPATSEAGGKADEICGKADIGV
jgi:hypothetical protein